MNLSTFAITTCCLVFSVLFVENTCADFNQKATGYEINIRSCDEIWIISSRQVDPCKFVPEQLCVQQFCSGKWEPRKIGNLLQIHQTQIDKPIVMYLHGYRLDYYWARRRGLETYQDLTVPRAAAPPIRFVIWAWPSEDRDFMIINYTPVLRRSVREGNILGWFLAATADENRVGVLSYSMGAQVLGSAFEVAHARHGATDCCRSVAIGSITNCRWPRSPQQASATLAGMGNMLIVDNHEDPAIRTYQKYCKLRRPGSPLGLDWLEQHDHDHKLQRIEVSNLMGEKHQIHQYLANEYIVRYIVDQLVDRKTYGAVVGDPCENRKHYEHGNPASNPRRKKILIK